MPEIKLIDWQWVQTFKIRLLKTSLADSLGLWRGLVVWSGGGLVVWYGDGLLLWCLVIVWWCGLVVAL